MVISMPALNCKRESCAGFTVVRKDGTLAPLGGIPKGETELRFNVQDIIGHNAPLSMRDGGPYRILSEAYYQKNNEEFKVLGKGIVYLLILKPGYVPLGCENPDAAWSLELGDNCEAQYSTKMRTGLCGEGCN
jgi:hypothetical protein